MKFDVERALAVAKSFGFPRPAGSDGERHAADLVAEHFEQAGLRVERFEVIGSRFPELATPWLGWLGAGALMTLGTVLTLRGTASPARMGAAVLSQLWFRVTAVYGFRFGWGWPPRVATENVVASRTVESSPPVRVVFVTHLDEAGADRPSASWWHSSIVIGTLLTALFLFNLSDQLRARLPARSALLVLVVLWLAILSRILGHVRAPTVSNEVDNRTGLALLLELARTWSIGAHDRVETRFAATGGQALDFAGARSLVRTIATNWPSRPTLVISFHDPGAGNGLDLVTRKHARLAGSAAADLWVPHQVITAPEILVGLWPFEIRHKDVVCVVGNEMTDDPSQLLITPEALGRAAQLATEIALRWAKQRTAALHGESLDRSSQKLG